MPTGPVIQRTIPPRAWVLILCLAMLWGCSFVAVKVALPETGPFTLVALRVVISSVALWAWVFWRRLPLPRGARLWMRLGTVGIVNSALPFMLIIWGQQHIEAGLAAILNASTAVFSVVVASLVFADERLAPRKLAGVIIGFAGVVTAVGPAALGGLDPGSLGQISILGGALCYAVAGAYARNWIGAVSPEVASAVSLTAATALVLPLAFIFEGAPDLRYPPRIWFAILWLSLLATALAFFIYYRVLHLAGSGNVSLVTLLVAPIAIFVGWIVLGETLSPQGIAGFVLIAAGLLVLDGRILRAGRRQVG